MRLIVPKAVQRYAVFFGYANFCVIFSIFLPKIA